MQKTRQSKCIFVLLLTTVLLLGEIPSTVHSSPDFEPPGCTRVDSKDRIVGFPSTSCSNLLQSLACVLVADGVDTIDLGRYKGNSFPFDAECQDPSGGSQVYHYKTMVTVYKEGINSYEGTHDTFIRPDHPDSVMPPRYAMEVVAKTGAIPCIRGVVRFADQQVLPPNAQILAAELTMVCQQAVPLGGVPGHLAGGGMNVNVYGLLKEFMQDEATWNHYASSLAWEIPGAEGITDRFATADDTQFILTKCDGVGTDPSSPTGGNVVPAPYTWNVLGSYLTQREQGREEYGWVFFTLDGDEDSVRFFTHEMNDEFAPELMVRYVK